MKHDLHELEEIESTSILTEDRNPSGDEAGSWERGGSAAEEMRRKVEAAATPGAAHKSLEDLIGDWKAEVKCWHEPGGTPEVSRGTAKVFWILGGHFLKEEFTGRMMGRPFYGLTLMGYDNTKQTFNSVWVSDMQTSMFISEGKGESGNQVITLEGKATCAATGRTDLTIRTVLRILDSENHVFEMYDTSKGEKAKTLEIVYTRQ
jgi:hypothetical protein